MNFVDLCKKASEKKVVEIKKIDVVEKRKVGRPKKVIEQVKPAEPVIEAKDIKKKKNGYDKFAQMCEDYQKKQPEYKKAGYKHTHDIILNHMKELCESSEEYNAKAMHECKTSEAMMKFIEKKAFENYNVTTDYNEAMTYICTWADEYIGQTADVKKWEKEQEKKANEEKRKKELEPAALEELKKDKKYIEADDSKKKSMLKNKVDSMYILESRKNKAEDEGDDE